MSPKVFLVAAAIVAFIQSAFVVRAQDSDDRLYREQRERESRIRKLSTEEQLKLFAAQKAAAEDAEVKAALEKRNKAIQEYRAILRATMIRIDPTVAPILEWR